MSELKDPSLSDQSERVEPGSDATPLSSLDHKGIAVGCFVLARCLQLGQAVGKNEDKAHQYYSKVCVVKTTQLCHVSDFYTVHALK